MTAVGGRVDAVLFDWGGTLTPWHDVDLVEQWRVYARLAAPDDVEAATAALLDAENASWSVARATSRSTRFAEVLATAGVAEHAGAVAAYRAFWAPHTVTDPDVPALFAALRERGIAVGVLSNTIWPRGWHEEVFERDGVLPLLDGAVYSSEIGHTKPHPEAFRAAMAAVGVRDPGRCVFVGDRPYDDISGAHAVGMHAVLVPHSNLPPQQQVPVDVRPDAVVTRLSQVLAVVDARAGSDC